MSSPNRQTHLEIPPFSFTDVDSVQQAKSSIMSLETGVLYQAAVMVDAMRRDDRISGCLERRTQALPALPFHLEPGKGAQAQKVLEVVQENFAQMFPDGVLGELQMWQVMLGVAPAQLLWEVRDGLWQFKLDAWHPMHMNWRWDTRAWHINTTEEGSLQIHPGDGQWLLYATKSLKRAHMWGASRYLYVPWLLRQWAQRDFGRWSENYGSPMRKAKTPAAGDEKAKQQFLRDVASVGRDTVIRLPTSADPMQQYDVELLEATSTGAVSFESLISLASTNVAIALLGQNLTTEVKGGAYAAAQVHESIRAEILQGDAKTLAQCIREQALKPWAAFNFGDPELAPTLCWNTDPPEDQKAKGDGLKAIGDGIASLRTAGADPDVDELLEKAGVPTLAPAKSRDEVAAEQQAKADQALEQAKAKGMQPGGPAVPPKPGAKLAADLTALKPSGGAKGQAYVDQLADDARAEGQRVIAPDMRQLFTAVTIASSYDDLRAQIIACFGAMDPEALADLMSRAMTMAELSGRLSALEDAGKA